MSDSNSPQDKSGGCAVCGQQTELEPYGPSVALYCPTCGYLLSWFRDYFYRRQGIAPESITLGTTLTDLVDGSLAVVELIMEIEDEICPYVFDQTLDGGRLNHLATVGQVIRYLKPSLR